MPDNLLTSINACVIIPTYNNAGTLQRIIDGVLLVTENIIIINDGSTDSTRQILENYPALTIFHLTQNKGKGNALRKGLSEADKQGYTYAISIDSDGQHYPDDIQHFIHEIECNGEALLIGARNMDQAGVPKKSSFGNRFSNFWFWFETGIRLSDTQSGFRLYPIEKIRDITFYSTKFEFEVEVIVKAAWRDIPVKNIPVKVLYDESERVSHFRPFRDFTRISILNTWLVLVTLFYIRPRNYFRTFREKGVKRFFFEDLLHSDDPILKKSLSVALGVFVGIAPIWGFQSVVVLFLAFILRLNTFIAFAFSNISIPPMIPFIIYSSYHLGAFCLGNPAEVTFFWGSFDFYTAYIQQHLTEYLVGSFALASCCAVFFGVLTFLLLHIKYRKKTSSIRYY